MRCFRQPIPRLSLALSTATCTDRHGISLYYFPPPSRNSSDDDFLRKPAGRFAENVGSTPLPFSSLGTFRYYQTRQSCRRHHGQDDDVNAAVAAIPVNAGAPYEAVRINRFFLLLVQSATQACRKEVIENFGADIPRDREVYAVRRRRVVVAEMTALLRQGG